MIIWLGILIVIAMVIGSLSKNKYSYKSELRKCESPIEERLMQKLYDCGYKPYGQVKCGNYRIDIAVYIQGKKIAIECDGQAFHTSPQQVSHDQKKNYYLEKHKWVVLRFRGSDIYSNLQWCIEIIEKRIQN